MRQATDSLSPSGSGPGAVRTGTVIAGHFRVEALLAREGGTDVYRATDADNGAVYALRLVPLSAIAHGAERLLSEVEKTQALRHKNLVEVEAAGIEGDSLFVATELVDGQTLREFIDAKRAEGRGVSLKGACNLVAHVANALDYASRIARHGALNPAIVWVNRAGRVKVSGLGLGGGLPSFARHGAPAGYPDTLYMAPEIIAGGPPKPAADVFSLGVIFYELLTGHPPGHPFQPASLVVPDLPPAMDLVIARAMGRAPESRWPSPTAFKEALQQAAAGTAAPSGAPRSTGPQPQHENGAAPPTGRPTGGARAAVAAAQPAPRITAAQATAAPTAVPQRAPAPMQAPRTGEARATNGAVATASAAPAQTLPPADPEALAIAQAMAAASRDETAERWLIQKDKLDFGPFSLVQIRAQIERGEILAEHVILDSDSGNRCRVREFPQLGGMAKVAQRRIEQMRRAQADQRSEKSEKKKSMFTAFVVILVAVAALGGVGYFLLSRHDAAGGRLASREEETEIDNYLKGVKISGMKASVRRAGPHRPGGGGNLNGGAAEDLNNDSNFGDSSKGLAEGDQTLDDDQIQNTMMANYRKLIPCIVHAGMGSMALEFAVRGNGKVSAVKVNGQRTGAVPACVLGRMQSFSFPRFNGAKTIASWSMSMGH